MPAIVLEILKYVFLVILYIFVARAIRAAYQELRPSTSRQAPPRRAPAPAPSRSAPPKRSGSKKSPRKLAVVEGDSLKGKSFPLEDELIVGRADKCHIKIDDPYASQMHARIYSKDSAYVVEDLGSTNGTYVNRRRITDATELHKGDQIKIGKTVMELRR
jgi:pSer/pThr/pTyr-binding forkhead associated (FHA) protein